MLVLNPASRCTNPRYVGVLRRRRLTTAFPRLGKIDARRPTPDARRPTPDARRPTPDARRPRSDAIRGTVPNTASLPRIYITGHRNPDADSIASAIGYAELKVRLDPSVDYVPVRLGDVNAQTRWLLDRSGAPMPVLLPHIMLRVRDVMRERFAVAAAEQPIREVGLTLAREGLDLVPVVDEEGTLVGIVSERTLARRYIRESREASTLAEAPTTAGCVADVLEGELITGERDHRVAGRVWVHAMEVDAPTKIAPGDTVVVGNRADAQRLALELGASLLIVSNGSRPSEEIVGFARELGTAIIASKLDTYVSARLVTLSAPSRALMDAEPLTVSPDDLISDISDPVKDIDYRAAVAVDGDGHPSGVVTRSDLVSPAPRRVVLVDHAEQAQSVIGIQQAEIVEILDHHHIGSIETRIPVTATFDPVGSTATLVVERFRQSGLEPSPPTATMLLGAALSDTVILNSPRRPTATTRWSTTSGACSPSRPSSSAARCSRTRPTSPRSPRPRSSRATPRSTSSPTARPCPSRRSRPWAMPCWSAARSCSRPWPTSDRRAATCSSRSWSPTSSARASELLVAGDARARRAGLRRARPTGSIALPGVMSRKKQVAPKLLAARGP